MWSWRTALKKNPFKLSAPESAAARDYSARLCLFRPGWRWLRYIRQHLKDRFRFWPFDGWTIPTNRSVVAEVYPALWSRTFPSEGRTADQQDAFAIAKWMRLAGCDGSLEKFFCPEIELHERKKAGIEGWILGVL